jgi:AraC-like DNA-binding protein
MNHDRRRTNGISHIGFRPAKPYPYSLETFRVSDLRRRTSAEGMHRTYSYEFYMLLCVTSGRCVQVVDFEPVSCSPGTLLALRPGQAHNFGSPDDWDGWMVLFRPEVLLPTRSVSDDPRLVFDLERLPDRLALDAAELDRAANAILRMHEDALINASGRSGTSSSDSAVRTDELAADIHALLRYQLYAFVTWLTVVHGQKRARDPLSSGALERFRKFQELVERRFAKWSQLGDYARHLGCTEKSLLRATRMVVGVSAKEFISRRINLEAKRLLVHTDWAVSVIASKLGFEEATHFSKFFRREVGCSPRVFRARSSLRRSF